MANYLPIKSTIVLLLYCSVVKTIGALKTLAINQEIKNNFIEPQAELEEQAYKKRCIDPEIINLDSYHLKYIKDNSMKSQSIRSLSISKNEVNNIPTNMLDNLPYLNCLNVSDNYLNIYDGSLSLKHEFLTILDLSSQKKLEDTWDIETLKNENIISSTKYEYIIFKSSNIWLPNLRYIDLSDNDISRLEEDFRTKCPKLMYMFLNNIKSTDIDPFLFTNLLPESLRYLSLKNNEIRNFTFYNVANILTLYLDSNHPLENIDIFSLTLQHLSLSDCTKLNNVSLNTPNLQYLDISKNYNNDFLLNFGIPHSLKTLILDYNEFSQIPQITGLYELIELSLNHNAIKTIRAGTLVYPALEKLQLKGNQIQYFDTDTFIKLPKLKYLDLSYNKLETLSYGWIFPLMNLKYLNVNKNSIATISDLNIYGSRLEHLSVKNNNLKEITSDDINILLPDNITVYIS